VATAIHSGTQTVTLTKTVTVADRAETVQVGFT